MQQKKEKTKATASNSNQSNASITKAQASRAAAFVTARISITELATTEKNLALTAEILMAMRNASRLNAKALELMEHLASVWREHAAVARPELHQAIQDLDQAETKALEAGCRPIRSTEIEGVAWWLDIINNWMPLPKRLRA